MGRASLALTVALTVLPLCANAQAPKSMPRVGLLQWEGCPGPNSVLGRALNDLGYTWGERIQIVCRSAEGSYRGLSKAADDLVTQRSMSLSAFRISLPMLRTERPIPSPSS